MTYVDINYCETIHEKLQDAQQVPPRHPSPNVDSFPSSRPQNIPERLDEMAEADGFDMTTTEDEEDHDEWGGRGGRGANPREAGPTTMVVNAIAAPGGSGATAAAAARGQSVNSGQGGGGARRRWGAGRWAAVDVRAVQSRISRIVDDTSARIRSNIVIKVCVGPGKRGGAVVTEGGLENLQYIFLFFSFSFSPPLPSSLSGNMTAPRA